MNHLISRFRPLGRSWPPDGTYWPSRRLAEVRFGEPDLRTSRPAARTYFAAAIIFIAAQIPSADFIVEHIGEDRPAGALVQIDADGAVQLAGGKSISGKHVVALRRSGSPPHRPHDRPHILLADGDCLPGRLVSIENERVRFAADLGVPIEVQLPLSAVSAVCISPKSRSELDSSQRHDTVRLSNGDTMTGTILSLAANGPLRIESGGQTANVARDRIDSLIFNSELTRAPKPRGAYRRIVTRNGARISLATASADATNLTGKTLFGETITIPVAELAAMTFVGGPAVFLSDLKPVRYEHTPYLGVNWPLAADRSVAGNELRLAGGTFDKGLGLHSACSVTYSAPPKARRFEALIGLDEETGRRGAVSVDVRADGQSLLSKPLEIAGRDSPRELRLPLPPGCKELTIIVEFGPGGDVQDHVNLADARFVVDPS